MPVSVPIASLLDVEHDILNFFWSLKPSFRHQKNFPLFVARACCNHGNPMISDRLTAKITIISIGQKKADHRWTGTTGTGTQRCRLERFRKRVCLAFFRSAPGACIIFFWGGN